MKWGIISTAKIGLKQVIPAMQQSPVCDIVAVASRNETSAREAAKSLGIDQHYDDYYKLLQQPDIEAIYIPLPNHMHVEWAKKAMEHGKHVLCEKPIALKSSDINELKLLSEETGKRIEEAFMVAHHPQWIKAKDIIRQGELGEIVSIEGTFSYYNTDENNIRNNPEYGGGAMWDIGCYPVFTSRFVLDKEPIRVLAEMEVDKKFQVDIHVRGVLDFGDVSCVFNVSTQQVPYQRMKFYGSKKVLEILIPFNAPNGGETKILIHDGDKFESSTQEILIDACDQYTLQGTAFVESVGSGDPMTVTLDNSYRNTRVIESLFESNAKSSWITL